MVYAFSRDGAVPGLQLLAPRQQARPACPCAPPGSAPSARSSWRCRTCTTSPPTRRSRPSPSSASTSRTSRRCSCVASIPRRSSRARGSSARRGVPIINWIAIIWVVFIVILLMLPQYNTAVPWAADFTFTAFNYAPIAVARGRRRSRPLVRRLGPQVVQGPEGPGYRRGTGRDRARPVRLTDVWSRDLRSHASGRRAIRPAAPFLLRIALPGASGPRSGPPMFEPCAIRGRHPCEPELVCAVV